MVVQGTGQSPKYGGAGDRSIFGGVNMVAQGTGESKIWWRRGQVSPKSSNMVAQGTGQSPKYGDAGDRSKEQGQLLQRLAVFFAS